MKIEEAAKLQKRNPNYYEEIKILEGIVNKLQPMTYEAINARSALDIVKKSYKELASLREKNART